jgi:hypothetical protein
MTYRDLIDKLSLMPQCELDKEVVVNLYSNNDWYKVHNLYLSEGSDHENWGVGPGEYYLAVMDNSYNI